MSSGSLIGSTLTLELGWKHKGRLKIDGPCNETSIGRNGYPPNSIGRNTQTCSCSMTEIKEAITAVCDRDNKGVSLVANSDAGTTRE